MWWWCRYEQSISTNWNRPRCIAKLVVSKRPFVSQTTDTHIFNTQNRWKWNHHQNVFATLLSALLFITLSQFGLAGPNISNKWKHFQNIFQLKYKTNELTIRCVSFIWIEFQIWILCHLLYSEWVSEWVCGFLTLLMTFPLVHNA